MAGENHSETECQLTALRELEHELIGLLEPEIHPVLTKAYSFKIIGEEVRALARSPDSITSRTKTEKFLAVARSRIRADKDAFGVLLKIFRSVTSLSFLADRLVEKLCSEHKPALPIDIREVPHTSEDSLLQQVHSIPTEARVSPRTRKRPHISSSPSPLKRPRPDSKHSDLIDYHDSGASHIQDLITDRNINWAANACYYVDCGSANERRLTDQIKRLQDDHQKEKRDMEKRLTESKKLLEQTVEEKRSEIRKVEEHYTQKINKATEMLQQQSKDNDKSVDELKLQLANESKVNKLNEQELQKTKEQLEMLQKKSQETEKKLQETERQLKQQWSCVML